MTMAREVTITPELTFKIDQITALYEQRRAAMLPILNLLQEEFGAITPECEQFVAEYLQLAIVHVREVVSFYTMLHTKQPGKCHLQVCTTTSCALAGANELVEYAKEKLGIGLGETTPDGKFTLERVECLGACESAPVMQMNKTYIGDLNTEKMDQLFATESTEAADWFKPLPKVTLKKGEPMISKFFDVENGHTLDAYLKQDGFAQAKNILGKAKPTDLIEAVKQSNLRGLGGAGFSVGMKWSFIPKDTPKPKYLVVNADESEPGTFKDKYILGQAPHLLLEGMLIAAYANGIHKAYIYIRKEYDFPYERLEAAVKEAYVNGYLGKNIFGSGFDLDVVVHRGAGAYICGEESALLESLEGKKGFPRLKPPFPAVVGLFGCPTLINNVETLSYLRFVFEKGPEWFAAQGTEKCGGMKLFCVSGQVERPGVYELPIGTPLREIIYDYAGGVKDGKQLKAVIPGGISASILSKDEIDVAMDFDALKAAGTMLGSAGIMVLDEDVNMVEALTYAAKFFAHESCGQCSPCREGTGWILRILKRMQDGKGQLVDIDNLNGIASNIAGNTICAFGDASAMPVNSYIKKFRPEFEEFIRTHS